MLTQEQIDFFHTHGYLIMRGLIRGQELAVLQEQADHVIAQALAGQGEHHLYRTCADGRKTYWRSEEMWQRDPIFQAVTVNPDLLENIGQCIGQPFYPWNDSLVV
jgi:phytanoyl-CoA hydroxylase